MLPMVPRSDPFVRVRRSGSGHGNCPWRWRRSGRLYLQKKAQAGSAARLTRRLRWGQRQGEPADGVCSGARAVPSRARAAAGRPGGQGGSGPRAVPSGARAARLPRDGPPRAGPCGFPAEPPTARLQRVGPSAHCCGGKGSLQHGWSHYRLSEAEKSHSLSLQLTIPPCRLTSPSLLPPSQNHFLCCDQCKKWWNRALELIQDRAHWNPPKPKPQPVLF